MFLFVAEMSTSMVSGGWYLPMEITEMILAYSASVDVSSRQRLHCVCKDFHCAMERVCRQLPSPSIYISPLLQTELGFDLIRSDSNALVASRVGRFVRIAGPGSGIALRLHELLSIDDWCRWYVVLEKDTVLPGWFYIIRVFKYLEWEE